MNADDEGKKKSMMRTRGSIYLYLFDLKHFGRRGGRCRLLWARYGAPSRRGRDSHEANVAERAHNAGLCHLVHGNSTP